jgi:hypothetical protein
MSKEKASTIRERMGVGTFGKKGWESREEDRRRAAAAGEGVKKPGGAMPTLTREEQRALNKPLTRAERQGGGMISPPRLDGRGFIGGNRTAGSPREGLVGPGGAAGKVHVKSDITVNIVQSGGGGGKAAK